MEWNFLDNFTASMNTCKYGASGVGTQTAALALGGISNFTT
jgi:hypothetical protein